MMTALITGASAGLGREFAWLFAEDGHDVVLVARRKDKLEALAKEIKAKLGREAYVLAQDFAEPGAAERTAKELDRRAIDIDFLVNNAGFGTNGAFCELDARREMEMIQVNIASLVHLTRLLLPAMIARGTGRILNVGSTAGFQPGPYMAVYYASKAFVNSFTEALALELEGTGVTATLSCPGATATEFAQVAGNAESRLFQMGAMGSRDVAQHAYRAMMKGDVMAVPGFKNKVGVQSLRFAPRAVVRSIAAKLNRTQVS
jgi:uncharacterized protein